MHEHVHASVVAAVKPERLMGGRKIGGFEPMVVRQ
jgi:hypothetical protein